MGSGLEVEGLEKRFGSTVALKGIELTVPRGRLVGFLGPNGAGKTTTMRGIMGLVAMDAGSVRWDGRPISPDDRRHIGYMPQERGLYPRMKVHEHIAYMGRLAGLDREVADDRAFRWAERVGLDGRGDDLIQELSGGNQQRVQLAVALVHEPDWQPANGDRLDSPEGVSRFVVPAGSDASSLIASAAEKGEIASVSFEPPGLDGIFLELMRT